MGRRGVVQVLYGSVYACAGYGIKGGLDMRA